MHIREQHEQCEICKKDHPYVAYKDASTLRAHYQRSHYVCAEPECKENLYIVFSSPEELDYHYTKTHRAAPAGAKKRYDANALLGLRIEENSDNDDDHGHNNQQFGRGGRGRGRGGASNQQDPKSQKSLRDNLGYDFQEFFKRGGDSAQIELLPSYVSDKEGEVDLRYFLIASRNFNNNVKDGGDPDARGNDEYVAKFTVDDFEAPSQRSQTVEQLFKYFDRYFGNEKSTRVYSTYQKYKDKKLSSSTLLDEFKKAFGIIKGYKFCWALSLAGISQANELANTLKIDLRNYGFRNPDSVLGKHGKSYHDIFKYLAKKLGSYLLQSKADLKAFPEEQLNKLISNIYGREIGLLISGKFMQHYISAKSLEVLINIFFTDKENYADMFDECNKEDLVTVYIYWVVIKVKTSGKMHSPPSFRGLDWLKDIDGPEAVSFIKISTSDQVLKKEVKKENKKYTKEEFPTLTDVRGDANQKDLLEFLRNNRNQKANSTALKYNKRGGKQNKQIEIPLEPVKFTQPKYRDSDDEYAPPKKTVPVAATFTKPAEVPKKELPVRPMEEDWPSLGGNQQQKFVMKPDPLPIRPVNQKKPIIREVSPQKLEEEDFPTFDDKKAAVNEPTIFDQLKQTGKTANNAGKGKGKISNVQKKVNTQAMNVANFNNQQKYKEAKEVKEDFPGLTAPAKGLLSNVPEVTAFDDPAPEREDWMQVKEPPRVEKTQKKANNKIAGNKKQDDDDEFPQFDADDKADFPPPKMATSFGRQTAQDRLNQNLQGFLKEAEKNESLQGLGKKGKVFHLSDLENVKSQQLKLTETKKDFDEVHGFDDEPAPKSNGKAAVASKPSKQDAPKQPVVEKAKSNQREVGDFPSLGGPPPTNPAASTGQSKQPVDIRTALIIENSDLTIVKKKSKKK